MATINLLTQSERCHPHERLVTGKRAELMTIVAIFFVSWSVVLGECLRADFQIKN
jgi:hypothetical protein